MIALVLDKEVMHRGYKQETINQQSTTATQGLEIEKACMGKTNMLSKSTDRGVTRFPMLHQEDKNTKDDNSSHPEKN